MGEKESSKPLLKSWNLLSIVVFNLFFFWLLIFKKGFGINISVFEVLSLIPILAINKNRSSLFYTKILLAVVLSMFIWIRGDFLTVALSLLTTMLLNIVIFQEAITGELVSSHYFFDLPFMSIGKVFSYSFEGLKFLVSWRKYLKKIKFNIFENETARRISVGILISTPVLIILILLFSAADQSFKGVFVGFFNALKKFFEFSWVERIDRIFELIWQFGVFWIYLCLIFPFEESHSGDVVLMGKRVEKITVVVLVGAIFALFIATQAKSFNFILEGFTSSKLNPRIFVREGFGQLIVACLVGITVFKAVKGELGKSLLTILLLTEILLVSFVAGERVFLYQYQFGFTQARIWGILFLIFVLIVIGTLFLELFKKIGSKGEWQSYLFGFSLMALIAGLINVDYLVAIVRPPIFEEKVDSIYIVNNLSWDAVDYWTKNLKDLDSGLFTDCKPQENPRICDLLLEQYREEYVLTQKLNTFLVRLRGFRDHGNSIDYKAMCGEKADWFTQNLSTIKHTKDICDNYENWMAFKSEYEAVSKSLHPDYPSGVITFSPGGVVHSCRTLGTVMIVGNDGYGQIGCDVEVDGQPDLAKSYCESDNTRRKQFLMPDAYSRPNRYYTTLKGLSMDEKVRVFVFDQSGTRIECSPTLN